MERKQCKGPGLPGFTVCPSQSVATPLSDRCAGCQKERNRANTREWMKNNRDKRKVYEARKKEVQQTWKLRVNDVEAEPVGIKGAVRVHDAMLRAAQ